MKTVTMEEVRSNWKDNSVVKMEVMTLTKEMIDSSNEGCEEDCVVCRKPLEESIGSPVLVSFENGIGCCGVGTFVLHLNCARKFISSTKEIIGEYDDDQKKEFEAQIKKIESILDQNGM